MDHYADAFTLDPERCFRMISAGDGTGHARHCPHVTVWRGRFRDGSGTWHTVEACDGHRADLDSVHRIPELAGERGTAGVDLPDLRRGGPPR